MLDPKAREFLDYLASLNLPPPDQVPVAEHRARYEETFTRLGGPPPAVGDVRNVEAPGPRGPIPIRVYTPEGATEPPPLLAFYHGGGWVNGSRDSYDSVCRVLTRESGCVVASVDYRRAPEHPAPEPFEDCYAATVWLAEHGSELNTDSRRLAVGGDSAGGNLAAAVAQKARDTGTPRIAHQLLVYPAVDEDESSESYMTYKDGHFLTGERMTFYYGCFVPRRELADVPYVLPARAATLRGLPSATIILAECDPLRDQGLAYAERLRADGVPVDVLVYQGQIHGFFSFIALFEQGLDAVEFAGRAVGAALGRQTAGT
jgi:acetyl esterase